MGRYFLVNMEGGLEEPLAIPEAGFGSFSPDGNQICYTPISREFRTWKRYKGGRAADVWTYDLIQNTSKRITTFTGSDQVPSWYGSGIYFASDRDDNQKLNIWRYDVDSGKMTQVTHHDRFDVLWPSGTGGILAYENGGYIYLLNLDSGKTSRLKVSLNFDNPNVLAYVRNVSKDIHSMDISPSGKRAVLDARGDIFTVPAEHGITRNLTRTEGIREIFPAWSPDGKWIAYCSDATGEYELYLRDQEGKTQPRQLTRDSKVWKFPASWSPDGKWLLYADKGQTLHLLSTESGEMTVVDKAKHHDFRGYVWSPDSMWIAYSKSSDNSQEAVWAWSLKDKKPIQLTGNTFNDYNPTFSTDGKYLFFLSDRDFNLAFSGFEFNYLYNKATRIYGMALTRSAKALFPDENDEEPVKIEKPTTTKKKGKQSKGKKVEAKESKPSVCVIIDTEGIRERVVAFPQKSGRYWNLKAVKGGMIYNNDKGLHRYNIKEKKDNLILAGVRGGILAAGGEKVLYRKGSAVAIAALKPGQKPGADKLDLSEMTMKIDPRTEWKQIYADGWRIYRDWFYAENLHGVDWNAMKDKYIELLPFVSHRADLDYIFGELVGEMNVGHSYVNWGDFPRVKRMDTGLLGCEFQADRETGRYVFEKIFKGENWNKSRMSPLTEQGIDVREGDYLLKINGMDVTTCDNPYSFLEDMVGRRVSVTVAAKADGSGSRTFMVKPIKSELSLRYLDWVESRRKMVDKLSGG
ncbi:MAG: PD40 domain-containing protein, partial [Holophagae bacterium]|nr:PD40 domain-containing protein [Holophagae bacterium]